MKERKNTGKVIDMMEVSERFRRQRKITEEIRKEETNAKQLNAVDAIHEWMDILYKDLQKVDGELQALKRKYDIPPKLTLDKWPEDIKGKFIEYFESVGRFLYILDALKVIRKGGDGWDETNG